MIASQLNCALFLSSPKQAEHWDGQAICNFQKEDIADIRKLFTYRWLSHKDNETNWKAKIL